jgi:hypothetical protein
MAIGSLTRTSLGGCTFRVARTADRETGERLTALLPPSVYDGAQEACDVPDLLERPRVRLSGLTVRRFAPPPCPDL